jgi:hypothetical protein
MENNSKQTTPLKNWSPPTLFPLDFKETKIGDAPQDAEDGTYNPEST